jgi:hypothetical protein
MTRVGVAVVVSSSCSSSSSLPLDEKPYQQMLARPMRALMMHATSVPTAVEVHPDTRGKGPERSAPKSVVCQEEGEKLKSGRRSI